ncbi:MAG: MarR family transcriptional regulator [Edaphobacter sp.]|uniref:MarR family winged helix-turn-helix transcriptional regulator n=1 Tax=Edaphobacter sp. TaxID=1934404 RepID=UPI0023A53DCB|nr:MarR family transcriptional regulator [Edaphobacter sp.]MDE1176659.1 MarR family transcriptional regulator [Edaphobacter sp.]
MTDRSQEVADLAESIVLIVRRVRAAADDEHDLSLSERSLLGRLHRNGPATTADLARAEHMKPQSMGAIVSSLESLGLVRRKPHPTDGRQQLIELTPKGTALRRSIRAAKESWITQAVAELPAHEQKTLFAAGAIMRRMASNGVQQ